MHRGKGFNEAPCHPGSLKEPYREARPPASFRGRLSHRFVQDVDLVGGRHVVETARVLQRPSQRLGDGVVLREMCLVCSDHGREPESPWRERITRERLPAFTATNAKHVPDPLPTGQLEYAMPLSGYRPLRVRGQTDVAERGRRRFAIKKHQRTPFGSLHRARDGPPV